MIHSQRTTSPSCRKQFVVFWEIRNLVCPWIIECIWTMLYVCVGSSWAGRPLTFNISMELEQASQLAQPNLLCLALSFFISHWPSWSSCITLGICMEQCSIPFLVECYIDLERLWFHVILGCGGCCEVRCFWGIFPHLQCIYTSGCMLSQHDSCCVIRLCTHMWLMWSADKWSN